MTQPLFMEPIKGSQCLLQRGGQYFESLVYAHSGSLFARRGAIFFKLRRSSVTPSGAMVSGDGHTVETFSLPPEARVSL